MRTIVFSDAHGEPSVIEAVLAHSRFRHGIDRLIFAGDAIEVGNDSWRCLELLDELGAEVLVGNHEFAAWEGFPLEYDGLERMDPHVLSRVMQRINAGDWLLAAHADDVLVTHAGVCESFALDFASAARGDVARFVSALNEEFAGAVEAGPGVTTEGVIREDGPLWYRPRDAVPPLRGVTQVAGHTPPEILAGPDPARYWGSRGIHLIDPNVRRWIARLRCGARPPVRHALVEDGTVTVVEEHS